MTRYVDNFVVCYSYNNVNPAVVGCSDKTVNTTV